MKTVIRWGLMVLAVTLIGLSRPAVAQEESAPKPSGVPGITVMRFLPGPRISSTATRFLEAAITSELGKVPTLVLVERMRLPEILKEIILGETGTLDPATTSEFGQVKGLKYLVFGSVEAAEERTNPRSKSDGGLFSRPRYEAEMHATINIVSVATGTSIFTRQFKKPGSHQTDKRLALAACAEGIAKDMLKDDTFRSALGKLTIKVIQVKDEGDERFIRIAAGPTPGISKGSLLRIYEMKEEKLLDGTTLTELKPVCDAKVFEIGDTWMKLEVGTRNGSRFRRDDGLLKRINARCVAQTE